MFLPSVKKSLPPSAFPHWESAPLPKHFSGPLYTNLSTPFLHWGPKTFWNEIWSFENTSKVLLKYAFTAYLWWLGTKVSHCWFSYFILQYVYCWAAVPSLITLNLIAINCSWSFDCALAAICKNTFLEVYTLVLCCLKYIIYRDDLHSVTQI